MKLGRAGGLQIAFFTYALLLLAVPASQMIVGFIGVSGDIAGLVTKAMPFALFLVALVCIPPLRRASSHLLSTPIPMSRRSEVAWVSAGNALLAFAYTAVFTGWLWLREGAGGVEERIVVDTAREIRNAFSVTGIVMTLLLFSFLGPIAEEIMFRGFLYHALEEKFGWVAAMLLSATLFGLYHPHFHAAFTTSIVFVCVLRRTGSLWAPIMVHGVGNLMLWWPLLGRFIWPQEISAARLEAWYFHIACLAVAIVALPIYIWMSRERNVAQRTVFLEPDGALQK